MVYNVPRMAHREPALNHTAQRRDSNGRGRGIANCAGQPIAVRVPRLRGTQAVH